MSFLLKIVEGPNKGAEVALPEGVAVTLGKGDNCDIVLADPTLPDESISLEASAGGVTAGGEPLEQFAVKTLGATAFAVGPADSPWGELKWPEREKPSRADTEPQGEEGGQPRGEEAQPPSRRDAETQGGKDGKSPAPAPGREEEKHGRTGCLPWMVVLLLILLLLAWFLLPRLRGPATGGTDDSGGLQAPSLQSLTVSSLVARYGLATTNVNGRDVVTGNFATRRERLAATAEFYGAQPGIDLDLSDDESFRTACEDSLFTLTEGALTVDSATNRFLAVQGDSPSPNALAAILAALAKDVPKLRGLDVSGVKLASPSYPMPPAAGPAAIAAQRSNGQTAERPPQPSLPVCGILTSPYPCLVMRDGRRLMEGAALGDGIILEIAADSVVITNSAGSFTWRP